jgi:hypothetical protein
MSGVCDPSGDALTFPVGAVLLTARASCRTSRSASIPATFGAAAEELAPIAARETHLGVDRLQAS